MNISSFLLSAGENTGAGFQFWRNQDFIQRATQTHRWERTGYTNCVIRARWENSGCSIPSSILAMLLAFSNSEHGKIQNHNEYPSTVWGEGVKCSINGIKWCFIHFHLHSFCFQFLEHARILDLSWLPEIRFALNIH